MDRIEKNSREGLQDWIVSCTRKGKVSRNTIAVGLVVIDHLRKKCPLSREEVISSGGEIKGARSGLGDVLEKYGIPKNFLKEATTRQSHQDGQKLLDAFDWGVALAELEDERRNDLLLELVNQLVELAQDWLRRQNMKLELNRREAPTAWVHLLVESAKTHSGGVVEQHLVGAKLERRYPALSIPNHPAHAADAQTGRQGDFAIRDMVYHVTGSPGRAVIQKCAHNIHAGKFPLLLVPAAEEYKARALAQDEGIDKELVIISIESFVAVNIIEIATEEGRDFFGVLEEIVKIYNRRLGEVETDLSLQIEVR
jgi:hypothetical protein